ncbi:hypothetical protein [Alloyangia pacifica]|uniref:Uncharacterized protein n=1 Tax=Alloyangia pacifica TaxID=311180 RepID=A0A1I6SEK4_9RHOB|nr:hypothetical protein [Alloyangia pacifica]SDG77394.1 hypothetical protein SAMN04488245_104316 [Alloyangia pacifica]SFS75405.1 hypothetical protein SAMN04488050_104316 [Alloyangia pacifica]
MKKNQKRVLQTVMDDIERDESERAIEAVLREKMGRFIEGAAANEAFVAEFFFLVERLASKSLAKRIATHPARPDAVDDLHKQAEANRVAPDQPETGGAWRKPDAAKRGKASE